MFMSIAYAIKLHTTNRGLLILVVALDAISMALSEPGCRRCNLSRTPWALPPSICP